MLQINWKVNEKKFYVTFSQGYKLQLDPIIEIFKVASYLKLNISILDENLSPSFIKVECQMRKKIWGLNFIVSKI